jgi:hypothetical protein
MQALRTAPWQPVCLAQHTEHTQTYTELELLLHCMPCLEPWNPGPPQLVRSSKGVQKRVLASGCDTDLGLIPCGAATVDIISSGVPAALPKFGCAAQHSVPAAPVGVATLSCGAALPRQHPSRSLLQPDHCVVTA